MFRFNQLQRLIQLKNAKQVYRPHMDIQEIIWAKENSLVLIINVPISSLEQQNGIIKKLLLWLKLAKMLLSQQKYISLKMVQIAKWVVLDGRLIVFQKKETGILTI